jgi:hypothetical protein
LGTEERGEEGEERGDEDCDVSADDDSAELSAMN